MWGQNWGSTIWGHAAQVPGLGGPGLLMLALLLLAAAALVLKRRGRGAFGVIALGALVCVPLLALAQVTLPHTFVNGTVADADEVNANFDALAAETRSTFVSGWVSVTGNDQVTVPHTLGVIPSHVSVQVASSASASTVHQAGFVWWISSEGGRGTIVSNVTDSSVVIRTGNSPFCPIYDTFYLTGASNRVCLASGVARVVVRE